MTLADLLRLPKTMAGSPRPAMDGVPMESVGDYVARSLLDPNIAVRGGILPLGRDKQGELDVVLPQMLVDAVTTYKVFGDPGHASAEDVGIASMELPTGGALASSLAPIPGGSLGSNALRKEGGQVFYNAHPNDYLKAYKQSGSPMLSEQTPETLKALLEQGGKIMMTPDQKAGYLVEGWQSDQPGNLAGVFSLQGGRGRSILEDSARQGATHLDAYDSGLPDNPNLVDFYKKGGYEEDWRVKFDKEYAEKNTPREILDEQPDVVGMKLNEDTVEQSRLRGRDRLLSGHGDSPTSPQGLGELSPIVDVDGAKIPGGLDGEFTFNDLIWLESNPQATRNMSNANREALYAKHYKTMTPNLADPTERFNRILFGQLTANSDLTNSELMLAQMRVRTPGDLNRLASYIPRGKTHKDLSRAERTAISNRIIEDYKMQGQDRKGIGIAGSNDFSAMAEWARQFRKDPEFSKIMPGESDMAYIERLASQIPQISTKTGSLALGLMKPQTAKLGAVDRHVIKRHGLDEKKISAVKRKMRSKKTGDINPNISEHFNRDIKWTDKEPAEAFMFSDEYKKGLQHIDERPFPKLSTFGKQWIDWDYDRNYFAPHAQLYPGLHQKPRMPASHIKNVRDIMANQQKKWAKGETNEFGGQQYAPRAIDDHLDVAYWSNPVTSAMPSFLAEMLKEEANGGGFDASMQLTLTPDQSAPMASQMPQGDLASMLQRMVTKENLRRQPIQQWVNQGGM